MAYRRRRHGHGLFSVGIKALGKLMKIGAKTGIRVAKKAGVKVSKMAIKKAKDLGTKEGMKKLAKLQTQEGIRKLVRLNNKYDKKATAH